MLRRGRLDHDRLAATVGTAPDRLADAHASETLVKRTGTRPALARYGGNGCTEVDDILAATGGYRLSRRSIARAGAAVLLANLGGRGAWAANGEAGVDGPRPFSFERLIERTRELASQPYQTPPRVSDELGAIPIEVYERLNYRTEALVWADSPSYRLGFFLPASVYREPVAISIVEDGQARPVVMRADMFDLGALEQRDLIQDGLGFGGLRVLFPIEQPDLFQELLAFLGASYFRAVARGSTYGASARGLALNTGLGRPEEFPSFRQFWVQRPGQPFDPLTIYALMDSPSGAGAFRFDVTVRENTRISVDANIFFRSDVEQVGIAPLTSMYFFGPNDRSGIDDYRPAVHSSEGLALWTNAGEILWRPLANPTELRMSIFGDENPRGFGLLQRTREPQAYQDLSDRFDRKPNLWVEPRGTWGKGSVRLIEVPTQGSRNQNVAAFWTPEDPVRAGQELRLAYGLVWSLTPPIDTGLATVSATRVGAARNRDGSVRENVREVVIDYDLPRTETEVALGDVHAAIAAGNSAVSPAVLEANPIDGGWRLRFQVERTGDGPIELRAVLRQGERTISETWLYRLDNA